MFNRPNTHTLAIEDDKLEALLRHPIFIGAWCFFVLFVIGFALWSGPWQLRVPLAALWVLITVMMWFVVRINDLPCLSDTEPAQ